MKKHLNEKHRVQGRIRVRITLCYRSVRPLQLLLFRSPGFRELMRSVVASIRYGEGAEIKLKMRTEKEKVTKASTR